MMHRTLVCTCGKVLANCRCTGPKTIVVSDEPCTHRNVKEKKTEKPKTYLELAMEILGTDSSSDAEWVLWERTAWPVAPWSYVEQQLKNYRKGLP